MIKNSICWCSTVLGRSQPSTQCLRLAYYSFSGQRAYSIMSAQTSFKLRSFVPEVVQQVGDRRDLSNTRLAYKPLDKHATKELYKDVFVSPSEEDVSDWNRVSQDDVIRSLPSHAIIHTHPDIDDHGLSMYREGVEVGKDFKSALAALSKFPNLNSIEIGFTPECLGVEADPREEVAEDMSQRKNMLVLIFQAIKDRALDEKNRTIRKLTIINLQNCPIPDFTSSDLFRDVMSELEELHISIIQEFNERGGDDDYSKVELQTFPPHFCSEWLQPISGNLRALSLYHGWENWGPFPGYFDLRGISFPKLETLALGFYTLAHDNDLDWVLAIKSLRKLVLHNCMIVSLMRFHPDHLKQWKVRTHGWTRVGDEHDCWWDEFAYGGKWSQFLDRIAGALPNLLDFRFDGGSTRSYLGVGSYGVGQRDSCSLRIFPQRYVCFDDSVSTRWSEAGDDGGTESWLGGEFPSNVHAEALEADQQSLDRLLQRLRSRS